jgi:hypothetical protein
MWTALNPVLLVAEVGVENNTYFTSGTVRLYKTKIGDGVTAWTSLPYAQLGTFGGSGGGGGGAGSGEIVDMGDRMTGSEILDIGQRV